MSGKREEMVEFVIRFGRPRDAYWRSRTAIDEEFASLSKLSSEEFHALNNRVAEAIEFAERELSRVTRGERFDFDIRGEVERRFADLGGNALSRVVGHALHVTR